MLDVFRCAPSGGSCGRLAAVDIVVCLGQGEFYVVFFSILYFFERTRPTASMRPPLASFTPLLVIDGDGYIAKPTRDLLLTNES